MLDFVCLYPTTEMLSRTSGCIIIPTIFHVFVSVSTAMEVLFFLWVDHFGIRSMCLMQVFMFRQYFHTGATDELIFMQVHGDSKCGKQIRANTYTSEVLC